MKKLRGTIIQVAFFGLAMGYLEAVVVVYLREIYYPGGFRFPLVPISVRDLWVEIGREAATLVMLLMIGMLTGKSARRRFAFFLLVFGVWDIAYYLFLKLILGWPGAMGVPDILFLIPVPWVGPVWAPVILSVSMIVLSLVILRGESEARVPGLARSLYLLIPGALAVILSFTVGSLSHPGASLAAEAPQFAGWLFGVGELLVAGGILVATPWMAHRFPDRAP